MAFLDPWAVIGLFLGGALFGALLGYFLGRMVDTAARRR